MVDTQVRPSDVTKFPIIEAMLTVPREDFVPDARREAAYSEAPLDLGGGRAVLPPRTLAKMLDVLDIQPDEVVLDLACGLGYSSAVIARLADFVVALEEDTALAAEAEARLAETGADNVAVLTGTLTAGSAKHGPFDAIVIEGAVEQVPAALTDQLKDVGRIVAIFAEDDIGRARIGYRLDGAVDWRFAFDATAPVLPGFAAERGFTL